MNGNETDQTAPMCVQGDQFLVVRIHTVNNLASFLTSQSAYSGGPPSAHQRNAIRMAFRWRVDSGPLLYDYSGGANRDTGNRMFILFGLIVLVCPVVFNFCGLQSLVDELYHRSEKCR